MRREYAKTAGEVPLGGRNESCGDVDSSPILAADGTIYVGSDDGNLYALRGKQRGPLPASGRAQAVRQGSPTLKKTFESPMDARLHASTSALRDFP